eukprot:TRINITY_DN25038_c0_g1_i1.p1 TRINITY_DN25038_c0_g1~~TRINITY_DN25038_c0_g1_i1.p1  ORF type:complete len:190 (-),score=0.79 TRINITY_DN25038_c0_g1_i1:192-761(-)
MTTISLVVGAIDGRECRVDGVQSDSTCAAFLSLAVRVLDMSVADAENDVMLVCDDGTAVSATEKTLDALGICDGSHVLAVCQPQCGPCGGRGCVFCNWRGGSVDAGQRVRDAREEYLRRQADKIYEKFSSGSFMTAKTDHQGETGFETKLPLPATLSAATMPRQMALRRNCRAGWARNLFQCFAFCAAL